MNSRCSFSGSHPTLLLPASEALPPTPAWQTKPWSPHGPHTSPSLACCPGGRWCCRTGGGQTGFFAANFTLAEVRQLYARQAFPFRDQSSSRDFRSLAHPPIACPIELNRVPSQGQVSRFRLATLR